MDKAGDIEVTASQSADSGLSWSRAPNPKQNTTHQSPLLPSTDSAKVSTSPMHEYSLVMSLIERVESEAKQRSAKAIRRVSIRVGELSGVEADLLESAFEIARCGTLCESTTLDITREPARWACPTCDATLDASKSLRCGQCDSAGKLAAGGELLFEQMEIEI